MVEENVGTIIHKPYRLSQLVYVSHCPCLSFSEGELGAEQIPDVCKGDGVASGFYSVYGDDILRRHHAAVGMMRLTANDF